MSQFKCKSLPYGLIQWCCKVQTCGLRVASWCAPPLKGWFIHSTVFNEIEIVNVYDLTFDIC